MVELACMMRPQASCAPPGRYTGTRGSPPDDRLVPGQEACAMGACAGNGRSPTHPECRMGYAVLRWAHLVVRTIDSPSDPRTETEWGRAVGASVGVLRSRCRAIEVSTKGSLELATSGPGWRSPRVVRTIARDLPREPTVRDAPGRDHRHCVSASPPGRGTDPGCLPDGRRLAGRHGGRRASTGGNRCRASCKTSVMPGAAGAARL